MSYWPSNYEYLDRWKECIHKFSPWFGPVLKCSICGASTMVTMDKNESKAIFPPHKDYDNEGTID